MSMTTNYADRYSVDYISNQIRNEFAKLGVRLDFHADGSTEDGEARVNRLARAVMAGERTLPQIYASIGYLSRQAGSEAPTDPANPDEPGLPSAPAVDFRAEAEAMFPWLSGALLDSYANFWAETGSPGAAISKLRGTAEYGRVFEGIRREDGTLRMSENEYFSTKASYTETLAEFGLTDPSYMKRFAGMIANEVGAGEFQQAIGDAVTRFVEPGASVDNGLVRSFVNSFMSSGSGIDALDEIRGSSAYDQVFAGNRRDDGTLRMDEPEYFAYKRGWQRTLAGFGLNPTEFESRGRLKSAVEGELSIQEVDQRLQMVQDGILDQVGAIQQFYAGNYGLDVTAESILGMAIDPDVERDVLERRVTAGQIGGEASLAGFIRDIDRAEELARAGLGQEGARQLYSGAGKNLRGLSAATSRFNLGATTLGQYEDISVFQDADETRRVEQGLAREQSSFGSAADTRRDQDGLGLVGLRQR